MLLKLKELKVVFAAFTQHCIQSTVTQFVTHVERVETVKYSVYRASCPCQEGRF